MAADKVRTDGCVSMLKALADENRWRIVQALLKKPMTVGEICDFLDLSQYNVSKHLRILREAGIVVAEKDGKYVQCDVAPRFRERLARNRHVLDLGCCTFRFDRSPGTLQ